MKNVTFSAIALTTVALLTGCATQPMATQTAMAAPTQPASAVQASCKATTKQEIAALFTRWNDSLKSGDAKKVVANYAPDSILLPTVSNKPRFTAEEKEDYFHHFQENKPSGKIDLQYIQINCNTAIDSGLYTFTYAKTGLSVSGRYTYTYGWDGSQWLITSHHSSMMPEKNK